MKSSCDAVNLPPVWFQCCLFSYVNEAIFPGLVGFFSVNLGLGAPADFSVYSYLLSTSHVIGFK